MSAADPTLAARSRRHRARQAEEGQAVLQAIAELAAGQRAVLAALEGIAGALRNGGGQAVDNAPPEREKNAQSVAQRDPRRKRDARARVGDVALPPTGDRATTSVDVTEDAQLVLSVLAIPGSVAAITDAADLPRTRVAPALVYLQGHGLVRREEGTGLVPDRWYREEGASLDALADHPARPLRVEPTLGLTIACQDYTAHAVLAHRWDAGLGRFRCFTCDPTPMAPGSGVRPPAPGPGTVTTGGPAHA